MSYKVEVSPEDQVSLTRGTLLDWSRQEHDVHLVSIEGHKIFSHRVILSFYSNILREILNDPVTAFSPGPVTVSVPASASCISTMLKMLVNGKVGTDNINLEDEIRDAAKALGIVIKNYEIEHRKKVSSVSRLTITKMSARDQEAESVTFEPEKTNEDVPSHILSGTKRTYKKKKSKWNTSVVKNGMKVELKDFINKETIKATEKLQKLDKNEESVSIFEGKNNEEEPVNSTCDVCMVMFKEDKYLYRHRYRVHGLKKKDKVKKVASVSSIIVKKESESKVTHHQTADAEILNQPTTSNQTKKGFPLVANSEGKNVIIDQKVKGQSTDVQCRKEKNIYESRHNKKHASTEMLLPLTKTKDDGYGNTKNSSQSLQPEPGPNESINKLPISQLTKSAGPSPCDLCPKVFDTPENLKKHMNFRHPGAKIPPGYRNAMMLSKLTEDVNKLEQHECNICDKMFRDIKFKQAHMVKFHGDVNPNPILDPLNTDTEVLLNKIPQEGNNSFKGDLPNPAKIVTRTEGGETIETEETPEMDLCGYCGDKFDNLDILNEHIAMMHA